MPRTESYQERPEIECPEIPPDFGEIDVIEEPVSQDVEKPEHITHNKLFYAGIPEPPDLEPIVVPFDSVQEKPKLIKSIRPVYPCLAQRAGMEGSVKLKVLIDTNGDIEKYEFLKSNPLFNQAVANVIDKFKQIAPENKDIESFVIETVSNYVDELSEQKKDIENDPLYKWFNTPAEDKDGSTDVSGAACFISQKLYPVALTPSPATIWTTA